ncbi:unnamed protein product [Prunus armeniaca]|uniref:Uncharacterized protein n=1 Tax=Prunus armeniaca TaxID=36596 RepID=A0A6J5W2R2_PRUAR|nr:unnamed protein product [Prunus armeniaca]
MGQDPLISLEAGKFARMLLPALFAYATLQPLCKYLQTQSLIIPLLVCGCASLCFHIPFCWAMVFKSGLGHLGAALAIGMSYWLNVILLILYVTYSTACARTRVPISLDLLSTISSLYTIPEGLGAAGSTRVSNELGAGNPQAARLAVGAVMFLTVSGVVIISSIVFASRSVFGYIFSKDKEVVDYVTSMAPLICLSVISDNLHGVLSGLGSVCQPRSILSSWDSGCCHIVFLVGLERKGALDWDTSRFFSASISLLCDNKLYKLGRKGKKDKGEDICGKIYSKIAAVPFFLKQGSLVQCNHTDG